MLTQEKFISETKNANNNNIFLHEAKTFYPVAMFYLINTHVKIEKMLMI